MQSSINGGGLTASGDGTSFSASGTLSPTNYGISEDVTWSNSNRGVKHITASGTVHLANRPDKGDSADETVTIPAGDVSIGKTAVPLNNDYDNGTSTPDLSLTAPDSAENDLVPLVMHASGKGGRYQLEFASPYFKVWASADKSAGGSSAHILNVNSGPVYRVSSDDTIFDANVDTTVYVEGTGVSGGEQIRLRWKADPATAPYNVSAAANFSVYQRPTVTVSASDSAAAEAGSDTGSLNNGSFTFTRDGPTDSVLTVSYTILGTATQGDDYTLSGGTIQTITIAAGQSSATLTIVPKKDNRVESDETVSLQPTSAAADVVVNPYQDPLVVTISDDPPVVSVTKLRDGSEDPNSASLSNSPQEMTFDVERSGGDLTTAINVSYQIIGDTDHPASSADYTAGSTVSILGGKLLFVGVVDDSEVEFREGLLLVLNGSANYDLAPVMNSAAATIADNDFTVKAMAVSFNSQGITQDTGTQAAYGSNQWDDFDGDGQSDIHGGNILDTDKGYPISYQRSDPNSTRYIGASAGIVIEYKDSNVLSGSLSIFGFGTGTGGGFFGGVTSVSAAAAQSDGSQRVTISAATTSQTALPSTIDAGVLSIDWTLGRTITTLGPSAVIIKSPGTSKNRVYVTGAATANAFETVLDIGCSGATGKRPGNPGEAVGSASTANADVLSSIFDNKFKSLQLHDVEGNLLTYWGSQYGLGCTWPGPRAGTSSLLEYHDGRCGEWAGAFFPDIAAVQGVELGYKDFTVTFGHAVPAAPPGTQAGFYTPSKAQGNSVPTEQWFADHVIDEFQIIGGDCLLFDPSYGVRVSGADADAAQQQWGTQAINAGVKGDWVAPGGLAPFPTPSGGTVLSYTGVVQGSDPFPMLNTDFDFPAALSY